MLIHPGETIKEMLEDRKFTQKHLAKMCDVSEKHISKIVNGKANISPKIAVGLERAFGANASFWVNLDANYRLEEYKSNPIK